MFGNKAEIRELKRQLADLRFKLHQVDLQLIKMPCEAIQKIDREHNEWMIKHNKEFLQSQIDSQYETIKSMRFQLENPPKYIKGNKYKYGVCTSAKVEHRIEYGIPSFTTSLHLPKHTVPYWVYKFDNNGETVTI